MAITDAKEETEAGLKFRSKIFVSVFFNAGKGSNLSADLGKTKTGTFWAKQNKIGKCGKFKLQYESSHTIPLSIGIC